MYLIPEFCVGGMACANANFDTNKNCRYANKGAPAGTPFVAIIAGLYNQILTKNIIQHNSKCVK